jgi:hypothetical protein
VRATAGPADNLAPPTRLHPVRHGGACGARIPSPHPGCQALTAPYLAGELRSTTLTSGPTRVRVVWTVCHVCGDVRQRSEASA